jgi:myosin heavy subunit
MLIRISLIIAIILGLAATGLNVAKVKEKITTIEGQRDTEAAAHKDFEEKYTRTKSDLDKTNAVLKTTQATLQATEEEKNTAVQKLADQTKRADKLTEDLTKTRSERDLAQQELSAYRATGMSPQQVATATREIKSLQTAISEQQLVNRALGQKVTNLQTELDAYTHPEKHVELRADLKGKVLVADPKWNFVVLNIGEDQGVLKRGELLVNRNGKLVAKIMVSSVQKDRSVANIMPGWQLGEVLEGDQVIPAFPKS